MSPDARRFLNYEFATLSLVAALATRNPQAPVYRSGVGEEEKQITKDWLRKHLGSLGEQYRAKNVTDAEHVKNIATLVAEASKELGPSLYKSNLRFGVAQKLLNLYLKYLWATEYIREPPHCPIDGRIAQKAKLKYQWTTSEAEAEYISAIEALRNGPASESIATWELRNFEVGRQ